MKFSPAALAAALPKDETVQRLWVAFSGGLDSMVLLHALASLKLPVPVLALHVNHQISPQASNWQVHCAAACQSLQIPFYAEVVTVELEGRGLEDAARDARYKIFASCLKRGDLLLTAHHADDQTETLLLRLLRGAGPRGLAAMSRGRPLGKGILFRPLLSFSRAELEAYAQAQQLHWIEDESNLDVRYDRNFLRHKVIPLVQQRWPQLSRRVQQTAELCADSEELLAQVAAEDLGKADVRHERLGQSLDLAVLTEFSVARRHNLLRHWLRTEAFAVPEQAHLVQFEQQVMQGRADAEVAVSWGNLVMHRYRARLYVIPRARGARFSSTRLPLKLTAATSATALPDGGLLQFQYYQRAPKFLLLRADLPDLSLRWRQGGERCQPAERAHSQTLKRLLQEYQLEPWWRRQLPLLFSGETLVAAGDLWICHGFTARPGEPGFHLSWQPGLL